MVIKTKIVYIYKLTTQTMADNDVPAAVCFL